VYYELLSYLVNNGFPWREVASFFEIFQRLLNNSQGKPLVETISLFKEELLSHAQHFHDNNLKCAIDYTYLTLFQHYKLYQFVLTQDRASQITKLNCVVEPPLAAPAIKEGLPKSIWDEQQRLKQIDEMEHKRNQERAAIFEEEMQHAVHQLEEQLSEFEALPDNLTKEHLTAIIGNVAANKAAVASASISQQIHQMHDSLEFKYQRTNVGQEVNKVGKKSAASSHRSNGYSGKK